MKHIVPFIFFLSFFLLTGCLNSERPARALFVDSSIQDSLECFIETVGKVKNRYGAPTIATVSIFKHDEKFLGNNDTTITFFISYIPKPYTDVIVIGEGGITDTTYSIPAADKGYCMVKDEICLVRYENIEEASEIINESILRPVKENPSLVDAFNLEYWEHIRPAAKTYVYHSFGLIELIDQ